MSQEKVEIVKECTRQFAAGDLDGWRDHFSPEVVWDASAMPSSGVFRGHRGIEEFFGDWLVSWTDYQVEFTEYLDLEDGVVVVFRQAGTGRVSGLRVEGVFHSVWDVDGSKVVRVRLFEDREQALEAAGLSG
jgi:ketosteroid isomerase-like protein